MIDVTEQLKDLKGIKPDQAWVNSQRDLLLSQIKNQSSAKQKKSFVMDSWFMMKSFMPNSLTRFVAKPVGVMTVLVFFVLSTGILGVSASKGSLPGDLLYSVKLTSERVKVRLTVNDEKEAKLHVDFAENRVNEIDDLMINEKDETKKKAKIQIAVDGLKVDMKKAQEKMVEVKDNTASFKAEKLMVTVKDIDKRTGEISAKLIEQKEVMKDDVELSQSLNEAEIMSEETSFTAVTVIVDKHEKGQIELTDKELVETVNAINKKLDKMQNKIDVVTAELKDVTDQIEQKEEDAIEAEEALENIDNEIITEEAEDNEANEDEPETEEVVIEETFVDSIQDKPGAVDDILIEAKSFLNQGDLLSAVEKIQESSVLVVEVKKDVEQIKETENIVATPKEEVVIEEELPETTEVVEDIVE